MDGKVVIGTELSTEQIDKQLDLLYGKLDELVNEYEALETEDPFEGQAEELLKLGAEINTTKGKIQRLVKEKDRLNNPPSDLMNWIKNFGKETSKVTRKVIGIGLAFFGIRSAYGFLLSSMNTLSNYNKQIQTDVQYIKFALATTLQPVIERIIQLAYQLLGVLGSIIKTITGVNIFKNAGIDKFQKGLDKSVGSAKELNKQLAGFDEMNVLQDTSSGGGGGGEIGANVPQIDLSQIKDITLPLWFDELASAILGVVSALSLLSLGLSPIMALGIGVAVMGIVYAIQGLMKYLQDPSWANFGQIIQGIGITVVGLGIAFLNLPLAVAGALIIIVGTIARYWDEIRSLLVKLVGWFEESISSVRGVFGDAVAWIYDVFVNSLKMIVIGFDNMFKGLRTMLDGIIQFVKGVFSGNWSQAWNGVLQIFSGIFQSIKGIAQSVLGTIMALASSMGLMIGNAVVGTIKAVVNFALGTIESAINNFFGLLNGAIKLINKIPGVNITPIKNVKFPRLAKGGIVNMPGRGINYGGANIGEHGREAVLPLQDSQVLSEIADAIGRRITINANITNTMNGRVISRELQKINTENDFAYNR